MQVSRVLLQALGVYFIVIGALALLSVAETWHLLGYIPLHKTALAAIKLLVGYGIFAHERWVVPALGVNALWVLVFSLSVLVSGADLPLIHIAGAFGAFGIVYWNRKILQKGAYLSPQGLAFAGMWLFTAWYTSMQVSWW